MFIKIAELWTRISEILKVGTMKMRKCLTKFSWLFLNSQHSPMCFYHRLYHREILSFLNVYPVHEYTLVLLRVVLRFKMRPAVRPKKASRSLSRKDLRRFDELANRAGPSSTSKPSTSAPSRTSRSTRRWRRRWRPPRTRSQAQRTGPAGLADLPLLQLALNCLRYLRLGCYSSKYQWCGWRIWESEILFS